MGIPEGAGGFFGTHSPGLKIPLLGLCILSTETESVGLPGLRARLLLYKF